MRCAIVLNTPPSKGLDTYDESVDAPRKDYLLLAEALEADLIAPPPGKSAGFRCYISQAWQAFRRRDEYDVVVTMSEQVGLMLALLLKIARCNKTHIMVSHYLTPARKSMFMRFLHVESHISKFMCYGTAQARYLIDDLGIDSKKVETVYHPVDSRFWRPLDAPVEKTIFSAGMLARDYETLLNAVKNLDVNVVVAASSPWIADKGRSELNGASGNVRFVKCTPSEMKEMYARSQFVVVPLIPVNIQAGSLVIYEAMAMGKAVITTANGGNLDIVRDGHTGYYVPPGDVEAMRGAITQLIENPEKCRVMGANARELVERSLNLDAYVENAARLVREAYAHEHDQPAQGVRRAATLSVPNDESGANRQERSETFD